MKIREKAQIIIDILESHYPKTPIPLDHSDNFTLLIAVLLSAQCKDERVNQITPKLFKLANDPYSMAKLSQKQIYEIIKPCGLGPQKSKAIKSLSKILVKDYQGQVPEEFMLLENSKEPEIQSKLNIIKAQMIRLIAPTINHFI